MNSAHQPVISPSSSSDASHPSTTTSSHSSSLPFVRFPPNQHAAAFHNKHMLEEKKEADDGKVTHESEESPPRTPPRHPALPLRSTAKRGKAEWLRKSLDELDNKTTTTSTTATAATSSTQQLALQQPEGYTALADMVQCSQLSPTAAIEGDSRYASLPIPQTRPLHEQLEQSDQLRYYRVAYRGVVALLSAPEANAPRTGSYLSYGECFCSTLEQPLEPPPLTQRRNPRLPAEANSSTLQLSMPSTKGCGTTLVDPLLPHIPTLPSVSSDENQLNNRVVRVDCVLTGGYAMDTMEDVASGPLSAGKTPKRSNLHYMPITDGDHDKPPVMHYSEGIGYLFSRQQDTVILEPLEYMPWSESGRFLYKIIGSAPIPILTGPALDAPKTKAMILPGSVHEVSLRVCFEPEDAEDGIWFLRLSHRRGWIADRKVAKRKAGDSASLMTVVVREVPVENHDADDGTASIVSSIAVSSVTAPSTVSRRRHRPPRRREIADISVDKALPRHIGGSKQNTPVKQNLGANDSIAGSDKIMSPTSNMSFLSDDESIEHSIRHPVHPSSPDVSHATSTARSIASNATTSPSKFYLMRVTAPRGLKILDAPHFQVNNLIHGKSNGAPANVAASHLSTELESNMGPPKTHHSIFQTMSGRLTSTGPSKTGNPAIFDASSKTRVLPRGVLFEASRRMQSSSGYSQGAGLIKLSDNSGWAIVPRRDELEQQYRDIGGVSSATPVDIGSAFEEVGLAVVDGALQPQRTAGTLWLRVMSRSGVLVSCPPPVAPLAPDEDLSPTSSKGSSIVAGSQHGSSFGPLTSHDSDVASSVGSAFLDAMFRTPKRNKKPAAREVQITRSQTFSEVPDTSWIIPCGMIVQVQRWSESSENDSLPEHARLAGGQGWIPIFHAGRQVAMHVPQPEYRFGSFWFRVQSARGIKVRLGPTRRAPSIKSEDGQHFRFECGEFLRVSEILTVFSDAGDPIECFAKLYRNRHVRLHEHEGAYRQLQSLTAQAEWVQVYGESELHLEECAREPHIERHKQGWRYNVVPDEGVAVRRGPSYAAEKTGVILFGGESVMINERVCPAGDKMTWLRLQDGQGWVYDVSDSGEQIMIAHSLRHRATPTGRPHKPAAKKEEIAYNTIIARLFHNDAPDNGYQPAKDFKGFNG